MGNCLQHKIRYQELYDQIGDFILYFDHTIIIEKAIDHQVDKLLKNEIYYIINNTYKYVNDPAKYIKVFGDTLISYRNVSDVVGNQHLENWFDGVIQYLVHPIPQVVRKQVPHDKVPDTEPPLE